MAVTLSRTLLAWRNPDGGWGYGPRKRSRIEPTLLAELALGTPTVDSRWLAWPRREAFLVDGTDLPFNYGFNGLALLAAVSRASSRGSASPGEASRPRLALAEEADALARALIRVKGLALEPSEVVAQDNRLQAWPWVEGTFSWVEPTAWCMLALKKWSAAARGRDAALDARLDEAERLLFDRACGTGGWNYGNPRVFGRALQAYVPTTALALLALQDRRDHPAFVKGLGFLVRDGASERSGAALALAAIALRVLERPNDVVAKALSQRSATTAELGQTVGVALAHYVLTNEDGFSAFRV